MTDILFSFDTEDFTSDYAADAIRDQAILLRQEGVRANFNIVGLLAEMLVQNRRWDVLDALKYHTVSFHAYGHSLHPTINEYTDLEDYEQARDILLKEECKGIGMVQAATGAHSIPAACPPGLSLSYVAMYNYAELGIPLYLGSVFRTKDGHAVHFCNGYHVNYDDAMEWLFIEKGEYSLPELLDRLARQKRFVLYNHPNKVLYSEFWDIHNFYRGNLHQGPDWKEAPRRPAEDAEMYYRRLRELVRALKADPRFRIVSSEEIVQELSAEKDSRTVTKEMIPALRKALAENFRWTESPVSLSVAECFYAAKHFLTSDELFRPGPTKGFLKEPVGAKAPVTLSAEEIRRLAEGCDPEKFLPESFETSAGLIGPADLLFAMLDIAAGADKAEILPRAQQCSYEEFYPELKELNLKGSWVHVPEFEDRYLSDRLRLQAWTIRPEVSK